MRLTTRTAVLFFSLLALTTGSSALATDDDWASAVDAAQAVDPAIAPPTAVAGDIRAVGGGDILGAGSTATSPSAAPARPASCAATSRSSGHRGRCSAPTPSASAQLRCLTERSSPPRRPADRAGVHGAVAPLQRERHRASGWRRRHVRGLPLARRGRGHPLRAYAGGRPDRAREHLDHGRLAEALAASPSEEVGAEAA